MSFLDSSVKLSCYCCHSNEFADYRTNIAEQEPVGAIFTAHRAFERDEGVPIGDQLCV